MLRTVFLFKRPSLCFVFIIFHTVERFRPSALAWSSTITLVRRTYNREHIFSAHRSHFYQRAVIAGMTAPQVTARVFLLGLLLAGLAIAAVMARSTVADILLLAVGAGATGFVLYSLARGGK